MNILLVVVVVAVLGAIAFFVGNFMKKQKLVKNAEKTVNKTVDNVKTTVTDVTKKL
jgi:hypothetical protein